MLVQVSQPLRCLCSKGDVVFDFTFPNTIKSCFQCTDYGKIVMKNLLRKKSIEMRSPMWCVCMS